MRWHLDRSAFSFLPAMVYCNQDSDQWGFVWKIIYIISQRYEMKHAIAPVEQQGEDE
jgi:hypothetical protein